MQVTQCTVDGQGHYCSLHNYVYEAMTQSGSV